MNTEKLEMAKTYNPETPDELVEEKKEENPTINPLEGVSEILSRHKRDKKWENICENDFSYLKVKDDSWSWHLIKLFNGAYGMVLDSEYILEYSSSLENTILSGQVSFRKEKDFLLEYRFASFEEFQNQMRDLDVVFHLVEQFETERGQLFYEYEEDAIYCYQEGYIFRLSGYSRNIITEYFQMYSLLMSFTKLVHFEYQDNSVLKYVYLLQKHGLEYLYKGIDLRKEAILSLTEKYKDFLDVVIFSLDSGRYFEILDADYYIAKRKKTYQKEEYSPLSIEHSSNWCFKGMFHLGLLGIYQEGELEQYNEIFESEELSEVEKRELLLKIVEEKEQECLEKKDYLTNQFLIFYFQETLLNPMESFYRDRWMDFLKVEKLPLQELSMASLEHWIQEKASQLTLIPKENWLDSEEWHEFFEYIDVLALQSKIHSEYLTITPSFLLLELCFFEKEKTYIITEDYSMMEWISVNF